MYHFIHDLYPATGKGKNLQLYFYDNENEVANRIACSAKVQETMIIKLMNILQVNPYSFFLKSLTDVPELSQFYITLKYDSGLDQRVYNLPTTSEVSAIWVDEGIHTILKPPIRIYPHSNKSQVVDYYYRCYDPLQYPLLFPYGQDGWHCGIKKIQQPNNTTSCNVYCEREYLPSVKNMCTIDNFLHMEAEVLEQQKKKRNNVSCREYYCYKIQMRDDENDELLHTGRIFQQYIVDVFIKVETQARFIFLQSKLIPNRSFPRFSECLKTWQKRCY